MTSSKAVSLSTIAVILVAICSLLDTGYAFSPIKPVSAPTRATLHVKDKVQFENSCFQRHERNHDTCYYSTKLRTWSLPLRASKSGNNNPIDDDDLFDGRTTLSLVGGQSLLIGAAVVAAIILNTPNFGFGPGIGFTTASIQLGMLSTIPLFILAYGLDLIEDQVVALQDVSKATQRSVLALLGGTFKPTIALITSLSLGLAAGFGEEMLFRGVLQYELAQRFGSVVSVGFTSIVFGALHAVTPLYAMLASLASVYFGYLYESTHNLAVPIVTHSLYDLGALLWAHWTVTHMTENEQLDIVNWTGPTEVKKRNKDEPPSFDSNLL